MVNSGLQERWQLTGFRFHVGAEITVTCGGLRSRYVNGERLSVEFVCDELVEEGRVGLSFGEPHDLADEEGGDGLLASAVLLDLLGIGGDDFVDHLLDGGGVADLLRLFALVDSGKSLLRRRRCRRVA